MRHYERGPLLSATKMWPMNGDFRAYEFCRNFRRGLLQRGDEPVRVEPLNLVIIHITACIIFSQISLRCVAIWVCIVMKALGFRMIQKQFDSPNRSRNAVHGIGRDRTTVCTINSFWHNMSMWQTDGRTDGQKCWW